MATVNDAKSLRKKENELNDLAVAYGVQQNLLIALNNLNLNPPCCSFDIGLPPYHHQSHLWKVDYDEELRNLAEELGIEIIANSSIERHVFHRMYSLENTLQILSKTISELTGRGFGIMFHNFFGFNLTTPDQQADDIEMLLESLKTIDSRESTQEIVLHNLQSLFNLVNDIGSGEIKDSFIETSIDSRIPDIRFIPNIGLTITF